MPWAFFHNLTPDDAQAIARYLKTLPASHNEIPPPLHYGVSKHCRQVLARRSAVRPGAASHLRYRQLCVSGRTDRGRIDAGLAWAQGAVLVAAIILFVVAPRPPETRRRWARAIGGTIAGVVILSVGYYLDATPALPILPPEEVSKGASGTIPRPDVSQASPERAALVARGRYIFANASCALCHGNDGAGGLR